MDFWEPDLPIEKFQSTHSRGVRHENVRRRNKQRLHFNPRTHGECDLRGHSLTLQVCLFQSTHSRGVRQLFTTEIAKRVDEISIHALTGSATWQVWATCPYEIYFNPRTHGECDVQAKKKTIITITFQSTHSRGVRHGASAIRRYTFKFQSTHSRGVRQSSFLSTLAVKSFQSTHSRGVRPSSQ